MDHVISDSDDDQIRMADGQVRDGLIMCQMVKIHVMVMQLHHLPAVVKIIRHVLTIENLRMIVVLRDVLNMKRGLCHVCNNCIFRIKKGAQSPFFSN
jgi:hypothetical protein